MTSKRDVSPSASTAESESKRVKLDEPSRTTAAAASDQVELSSPTLGHHEATMEAGQGEDREGEGKQEGREEELEETGDSRARAGNRLRTGTRARARARARTATGQIVDSRRSREPAQLKRMAPTMRKGKIQTASPSFPRRRSHCLLDTQDWATAGRRCTRAISLRTMPDLS